MMTPKKLLWNHIWTIIIILCYFAKPNFASSSDVATYTYEDDASWAVTSSNVGNMLGDHIKERYWNFIKSCQKAVDERNKNQENDYNNNNNNKSQQNCTLDDDFRIRMNHYQPMSVYSYTEKGYAKIPTPKPLFDLISNFYEANKRKATTEWESINTYHNMWESPPTIIHLTNHLNDGGVGGGIRLQSEIWKLVKPVLEEWTGQKLKPVSLYGIRLYHNGSILTPHVDMFPRIASCIINVDQDVEEDWPLEVYGHDGIGTNITMKPGDMVLYESHSVIHGRPFPLKGNFYANVFVHFEPVKPLNGDDPFTYDPIEDLAPYVIPNSPWEPHWRNLNPDGWKGVKHDPVLAAKNGESRILKVIAKTNPEKLHVEDELGWRPLHEAVRSGDVESVKVILENGADKNHVTRAGLSPLHLAYKYLGDNHPMVDYLKSLGAENLHPEL